MRKGALGGRERGREGGMDEWPSLALHLLNILRGSHLQADWEMLAPLLIQLGSEALFNSEFPVNWQCQSTPISTLFFFFFFNRGVWVGGGVRKGQIWWRGRSPLTVNFRVSSWTEQTLGTGLGCSAEISEEHVLSQRPGRKTGRGQGKRLWLKRDEKKETKNKGDLNIFTCLYVKLTV